MGVGNDNRDADETRRLSRRRALQLPAALVAAAALGRVGSAVAQQPATGSEPPAETPPAAAHGRFDITRIPRPPLTTRQAFIEYGTSVRHED